MELGFKLGSYCSNYVRSDGKGWRDVYVSKLEVIYIMDREGEILNLGKKWYYDWKGGR